MTAIFPKRSLPTRSYFPTLALQSRFLSLKTTLKQITYTSPFQHVSHDPETSSVSVRYSQIRTASAGGSKEEDWLKSCADYSAFAGTAVKDGIFEEISLKQFEGKW